MLVVAKYGGKTHGSRRVETEYLRDNTIRTKKVITFCGIWEYLEAPWLGKTPRYLVRDYPESVGIEALKDQFKPNLSCGKCFG